MQRTSIDLRRQQLPACILGISPIPSVSRSAGFFVVRRDDGFFRLAVRDSSESAEITLLHAICLLRLFRSPLLDALPPLPSAASRCKPATTIRAEAIHPRMNAKKGPKYGTAGCPTI